MEKDICCRDQCVVCMCVCVRMWVMKSVSYKSMRYVCNKLKFAIQGISPKTLVSVVRVRVCLLKFSQGLGILVLFGYFSPLSVFFSPLSGFLVSLEGSTTKTMVMTTH